jgi:hypothetical protein
VTEGDPANTPPSAPDGDGVRVTRKARSARRPALALLLACVVAAVALVLWRLGAVAPTEGVAHQNESSAPAVLPEATAMATRQSESRRRASPAPEAVPELPSHDPNDLASYFAPGDPEPTGAELIEALHDLGIRTGIGAFNPPGTSPVLEGIPVPDDYVLPEGYARHHQWTDEGEPISAILMYAPGSTHYGPDGRPIALPENGVVPPHLAPPGL